MQNGRGAYTLDSLCQGWNPACLPCIAAMAYAVHFNRLFLKIRYSPTHPGSTTTNLVPPRRVSWLGPSRFRAVSLGPRHAVAVCSQQQLYWWGDEEALPSSLHYSGTR